MYKQTDRCLHILPDSDTLKTLKDALTKCHHNWISAPLYKCTRGHSHIPPDKQLPSISMLFSVYKGGREILNSTTYSCYFLCKIHCIDVNILLKNIVILKTILYLHIHGHCYLNKIVTTYNYKLLLLRA